jgi:molybdopterin converting factor small subunit
VELLAKSFSMLTTPRSLIILSSRLYGHYFAFQKLIFLTLYSFNMSTSTKPPAGRFTILYFASASSYTSKDSETFEAPLPLSKLFETLEERYGGIKVKILESCLVTVNLEYVDVSGDDKSTGDEVVIQEGDEVAIIPPVSSG